MILSSKPKTLWRDVVLLAEFQGAKPRVDVSMKGDQNSV
jgi:hypothetical protein